MSIRAKLMIKMMNNIRYFKKIPIINKMRQKIIKSSMNNWNSVLKINKKKLIIQRT